MGSFDSVAVIEVMVKPGDTIDFDAPLVTLETDKATMDVPSTAKGVVEKVHVAKGGKLSPGARGGDGEGFRRSSGRCSGSRERAGRQQARRCRGRIAPDRAAGRTAVAARARSDARHRRGQLQQRACVVLRCASSRASWA